MSDDSFIREVDEELRHDKAHEFWSRFGGLIIGVCVLIVVGVGAFKGWEYYTAQRAAAAGDRFLAAAQLGEAQKHDEAIAALEEIAKSAPGGYPLLAQLRLASELQAKGDAQAAMAAFDRLAADASAPQPLRSVAQLRAGLIAVDIADYAAVKGKLETLAAAGNPYRHLAREALGLSAYKAGEKQEALSWFQQISDDAGSGQQIRQRAGMVLDLLAGEGVKATN